MLSSKQMKKGRKYMDWQEIRGNILEEIREIQEKPLRQYLTERNINDNFFYEYENINRELTIFTNRPGIWIGRGGEGVNRLKEILSKQFDHEVEVSFMEIKGRFMSH